MKNLETAFEYIVHCELSIYKTLSLHQRINYKSNWFLDPRNGYFKIMFSMPDLERFYN